MKKLFTIFLLSLFVSTISAQVLPVELTSFTAVAKKGVVELTFETALEINAAYFEIERGVEPSRFQK